MLESLWHTITVLIDERGQLLAWLGAMSLLMFLVSLIAVPLVISQLPRDYLRRRYHLFRDWPWLLSIPFLILKNVLGILFLISGLAMLVLPGQGLLTLLIGLAIIDFPRKHLLVHRVLGHRRVLPVVNRIRRRLGAEEMQAPPEVHKKRGDG